MITYWAMEWHREHLLCSPCVHGCIVNLGPGPFGELKFFTFFGYVLEMIKKITQLTPKPTTDCEPYVVYFWPPLLLSPTITLSRPSSHLLALCHYKASMSSYWCSMWFWLCPFLRKYSECRNHPESFKDIPSGDLQASKACLVLLWKQLLKHSPNAVMHLCQFWAVSQALPLVSICKLFFPNKLDQITWV